MAESDIPEAQWPVITDHKCELCDVNDISFKCLNCNEMICDSCKKIHLRSKMTKDHKVVCLKSAEIYQSSQIEKKCPTHTTEDLLMFCVPCQVPICRDCIASGSHHNHQMIKIENVIDNKQTELSKLINQSKEKLLKYKDAINTIDENSREFSVAVSKKIEKVKARNNQLKTKLDNIAADYIKQLQDTDTENKKAMTEVKQRFQTEILDLKQLIQQCEDKQRDRNLDLVKFVTDITQVLDTYRSCDPPHQACLPDFISQHIDDQKLKHLFGQLNTKTEAKVNVSAPQNRNSPSPSPNLSVEIVSSFTSEQSHVATAGNEQAWLWRCGDPGISLVTSNGKVIQNIKTEFEVYDAAVSTTSGDLFVTTYKGGKVKKLTSNNSFTDIYTADEFYYTRGITVTDTGNILVTLFKFRGDKKVIEITTSGQCIRTIQYDTKDNKLLYDCPLSICTNINGDIIVENGGNKLIAINKSGTKRFIYDGKERKLQKPFNPWYIGGDKYGRILITDHDNSAIHMLDQDGKFLTYLWTHENGCDKPAGMAIDNSGRLWLCNHGNKKIIIAKYV